jgi:hypothetical protein
LNDHGYGTLTMLVAKARWNNAEESSVLRKSPAFQHKLASRRRCH